MSDKNACAGGAAPKLISACSGAADAGAIADLGMEKGKTPAAAETVGKAAAAGAAKLVC